MMGNELMVSTSALDVMTLGDILVKSGFFSDTRQQAQAVVKVLAGQELGFGPVASMTGIHIIKGNVSLSANLLGAAIKRSGKYDFRVREHDNTKCVIEFFEHGESIGVSPFTMEDAKRAGLSGENWNKYPRNMLFARALSNGAKFFCPDVFGGALYTPDELGADIDGETGEVIEVIEVQPEPDDRPKPDRRIQTGPGTPGASKRTAQEAPAVDPDDIDAHLGRNGKDKPAYNVFEDKRTFAVSKWPKFRDVLIAEGLAENEFHATGRLYKVYGLDEEGATYTMSDVTEAQKDAKFTYAQIAAAFQQRASAKVSEKAEVAS